MESVMAKGDEVYVVCLFLKVKWCSFDLRVVGKREQCMEYTDSEREDLLEFAATYERSTILVSGWRWISSSST